MHFIEFSHVSKVYRKGFLAKKIPAVMDCSFTVDQGSATGFIGPNGAGKTTAIKMVLDLVRPTSGAIRINGKNPADPISRAGLAYISEQPYFYNHLTVFETLCFAAKLYGRSASGMRAACDEALAQVGMEGCAKRTIKDLSKGMQQRCSMAQALFLNPGALIMDEPLSGLDPQGRILFRDIMRTLTQKGTTIFFSTHVLDDIESVCGRVVALSKGRLEYQGPIGTLLEKGVKGTELTAPRAPREIRDVCMLHGWELTEIAGAGVSIFIPAESDVSLCQRFLFEHGLFCTSITKRTTPLEEILYR